jgi:predicted small lipoprotein YifL
MMKKKAVAAVAAVAAMTIMGLSACEKKGPIEQAAEEIDEAIDTAKRGEESVATKVDDAIDELRD